jgi:hypothetical protein
MAASRRARATSTLVLAFSAAAASSPSPGKVDERHPAQLAAQLGHVLDARSGVTGDLRRRPPDLDLAVLGQAGRGDERHGHRRERTDERTTGRRARNNVLAFRSVLSAGHAFPSSRPHHLRNQPMLVRASARRPGDVYRGAVVDKRAAADYKPSLFHE